MKYGQMICVILMLGLPQAADGQKKQSKKPPVKKTASGNRAVPAKVRAVPPAWGVAKDYKGNNHIYYPDYYAFYDPTRGYVYWNVATNDWTTSKELPAFMSEVDMRKTRVEILKGLSLDLHPERNYPNYMQLYPAKQSDPRVPVPNHRLGVR